MTMTRILIPMVVSVLLGVGTPVAAQTIPQAFPGDGLAWDQDAATLAAAQGFQYEIVLNGVAARRSVTCSGTASPFVCRYDLPATMASGNTISVITAIQVFPDRELRSGASPEFQFHFNGGPGTPRNQRILPGGTALVVQPPPPPED